MKPYVVFDVELYSNYFLLSLLNVNRNITLDMYLNEETSTFNLARLKNILEKYTLVGYNSLGYDELILSAYLNEGYQLGQLKKLSDYIIESDNQPWQIMNELGLVRVIPDHIDIMPILKGAGSLKMRGARNHTKTIQELPYPPDTILTPDEQEEVRIYCHNDLILTAELLADLDGEISLRRDMSEKYNLKLMSKSDAQIGDIVLSKLVGDKVGLKYYDFPTPEFEDLTLNYKSPDYIGFETDQLKELLREVNEVDYNLEAGAKLSMPDSFMKYNPKVTKKKREELGIEYEPIQMGSSIYTIGVGGLHSCEKKISYVSDDEYLLFDYDVASYYPTLIFNSGRYPSSFGESFRPAYKSIIDDRLHAKKNNIEVVNKSLKIVINGSYGKFGSWYSRLFAPDLLLNTTMTGQLSLLMLIERLELEGISVVSANTDGIVIRPHVSQVGKMQTICQQWEVRTKLELEATQYRSIHYQNVNNYIAIDTNDKVKVKGVMSKAGVDKNPQGYITSLAAQNYFLSGMSVEETIFTNTDIRDYMHVRKVNGGCIENGVNIGSVVRWYYSNDVDGILTRAANGGKVAKSDGAKTLQVLPNELPSDLDYQRYINDSIKNIKLCGAEYSP